VADDRKNNDAPLIERWLAEQQQWQRTFLTYLDSMVKNDDFLVHMGNAMRGSLLAGKAYPTPPPATAASPETAADDKLDQVLFALHQLQGQVQDLKLTLDELRAQQTSGSKKAARAKAKGGP
jgi:outer membrane murein-binding lipoprotein Lpp